VNRLHLGGSPATVRRRLLLEWGLVAVLVTAAVAALILTRSLGPLDDLAYDQMQRLAGQPADPSILLVEIDDRSIDALGAWPWSRKTHARMIQRLSAAGPRAIAYDVLFADPSTEPGADATLGAAIRTAGDVYLPLADLSGRDAAAGPPVPAIAAGAAGLGLVHVHTDADGLVRRTVMAERHGGRAIPDLMTAVDRATRPGAYLPAMAADVGRSELIPFGKGAGRFSAVSFSSLLDGEVPAEAVRDKIVLVGVTATGLGERFSTPATDAGAGLSGVELQADVLSALRTHGMITPAGPWLTLAFCLLPIWLVLPVFLLFSPRWNLAVCAALGALAVLASLALLVFGRVWLSPSGAVLGLLLLMPLWGWRRLAGLSDYLGGELQRLGSLNVVSPPGAPVLATDVITRQALSLTAAITQIEDMRRFAADSLFSLPDATLVVDAQARVIAANGAALALFGADGRASLEGRRVGELMNALVPQGRRFAADWPTGEDVDQGLALELADGRAFQVQLVERRGEGDAPIGWILRLADVMVLKSALRQREQAVQLLTHDMRSPQISILALLETAPPGDIAASLAARIAGFSRRTLDLADGFVHLARAEEIVAGGKLIDLCDVVSEAVDEVWPQSRRRGVEIRQFNGDTPRYVLGDRQILTRALINLISNAVKYGPENGVVEVYVFDRVSEGRRMVGVAVKDQGPGLTQEEAAAAFDAFRRFERAHPADGVGLGLAFVRAAATGHGGLAACHSAPGQGATFSFELPEAPDDVATTGDEPEAA